MQEQEPPTAAPTLHGHAADDAANQPWQASAQANGFTTPPPDRQSPTAPQFELTGDAFTGAPDITPQLTSLNPYAATPFTPRPLATNISRPLTSRGDPQYEPRPSYPAAFMPPNQPLPGQGNLSAAQTPPPYQASGPNDDTLPPRAPGVPGLPGTTGTTGAPSLPPLSDLDAPTLPGLNLPARPASSETPTDTQPPQLGASGHDINERDIPFPQSLRQDDEADDLDDDDDTAPNDPLAVEDALARALAGRDDALDAFDSPDGSPVTRRRMFFLRYLVRRRVYNEGFAPGEAPPQYHHSLGLDDDGADDTLPGF